MIRYILISGKAGSGKTTLAQSICMRLVQLNKKVLHTTFAAPLYKMHDQVQNVLREAGMNPPKKDRVLLQLLGTEWGRQTLGENIWVDLLLGSTKKWDESFEDDEVRYVIVSDCRFVNEFTGFPSALRIRLECDREARLARADAPPSNEAHPSEVSLDGHAMRGEFDMYFNTASSPGGNSIEHCTTMVVAALQKDNWVSKRETLVKVGL